MELKRHTFRLSVAAVIGGTWLALSCPAFGEPSRVRTLEEASSGLPRTNPALDEESYVPVVARRYAHARVLYWNRDLLEKYGIEVPPEGMTPEFEQRLLDAYAYGTPKPGQPKGTFLNKLKTFWADLYGGFGMTSKESGLEGFGSGRAAGAQDFQGKGIRTGLVRERANAQKPTGLWQRLIRRYDDWDHGHGGHGFRAGRWEAEMGEVADPEALYGMNRVALVISTGTRTMWGPIGVSDEVMEIRENSLRPAHLMQNYDLLGHDAEKEHARVSRLNLRITEFLPMPPDLNPHATEEEKLKAGMLEMSRRMGRKVASEYVHGLYQGATSSGNTEINGRAVDLSTYTYLNGHPKAQYVDGGISGDPTLVKENILNEFLEDLTGYTVNDKFYPGTLKKELLSHLPSKEELYAEADKGFAQQMDREFLWLAGVPDEMSQVLSETSQGQAFARLLKAVAVAGNDRIINVIATVPKKTGKYDVGSVLQTLWSQGHGAKESLDQSLARTIQDAKLREKLIEAYLAFLPVLQNEANKHSVGPDWLRQFARLAAFQRNRPVPNLTRNWWRRIVDYVRSRNDLARKRFSKIRESINDSIAESRRVYPHTPPYTVVVSERLNPDTGTCLRRVYDARTGQYQVLLQASRMPDYVDIMGRRFPLAAFRDARLSIPGGGLIAGFPEFLGQDGRRATFRLPDFDIHKPVSLVLSVPGHEPIPLHWDKSRRKPQDLAYQAIDVAQNCMARMRRLAFWRR